jgi:putative transposase
MPRRPRNVLPDGVFHVTGRGVAGCHIFLDDVDRGRFVAEFAAAIRHAGWLCHAYCLLGTHYHLVLDTLCERLSQGMHRLNGNYAAWFNRRHTRRGHLFENRYSSWVVLDDEHLDATLAYVLDNPVRAGLCVKREDWPWSGLGSPGP